MYKIFGGKHKFDEPGEQDDDEKERINSAQEIRDYHTWMLGLLKDIREYEATKDLHPLEAKWVAKRKAQLEGMLAHYDKKATEYKDKCGHEWDE